MKEIPLTQGKVALVDDEDYEELAWYNWWVLRSRHTCYAYRSEYGADGEHRVYMHRQIVGAGPGQQVDHADSDGLNNQRRNLRVCTNSENHQNLHRKRGQGTSVYKGVSWYKRAQRWRVTIQAYGKCLHLGYFDDEREAAKAYNAAAVRMFGEFAAPNEI